MLETAADSGPLTGIVITQTKPANALRFGKKDTPARESAAFDIPCDGFHHDFSRGS